MCGATAAAVWAADLDHDDHAALLVPAPVPKVHPTTRPRALRIAARGAGSLSEPLQDAAVASVGGKLVVLGGLNAADTSTADVRTVAGRRVRTIGRLPGAFHDGAAVGIGSSVYELGGGDGVRQLDQILKVNPGTGTAERVGSLPAPSSDHSAALVRGTAYVVGGYTGTKWLNTIVAWRPGAAARVVGRLPTPLRYAAVAAAAGRIVVAGGSLPAGTASRAIYVFDPASGAVRRLGALPAATTHAAAAAIGDTVLVIGGRTAQPDTPQSRIVAVNPLTGRARVAGRLPAALSDASAATLGTRVLVVGGRGRATVAELTSLTSTTAPVSPRRRRRATSFGFNVYAHDGPNALSPVVSGVTPRVYVPNSASNTVDVIDQRTF